jgi:hypothetical protein
MPCSLVDRHIQVLGGPEGLDRKDSNLYVRIWLFCVGLPVASLLLLQHQKLVVQLLLDAAFLPTACLHQCCYMVSGSNQTYVVYHHV